MKTRIFSYFADKLKTVIRPRPQLGEFISGNRYDYDINSSLKTLTPEKLALAMNDADRGETANLFRIFELIEHDAHIGACSIKRRLPIKARKFEILPWMTGDNRSEEIAEFVRESIDNIRCWRSAIYRMTDAIGKGFSANQIIWDSDGSRWIPVDIEHWPQVNFRFGNPSAGLYKQTENQLRILTDNEPFNGVPIEDYPGQWMVHYHEPFTAPRSRSQLYRAAVWYYCFKRWAIKDWFIFSERYGMPARVGKYPPGITDNEKKALWTAVKKFGRDFAAIIPDSSVIELIQAKATSSGSTLPYPELVRLCDYGISKLILGNTMALEPNDRGARSLGEVYERGQTEYTDDDCENLAETIRFDLIKPIVEFNYGVGTPIPYCQFLSPSNKDLNKQAERDIALIKELNLDVDREYIHSEYGIPRSESPEGSDLITSLTSSPDVQLSKKKSQEWLIRKVLSLKQLSDQNDQ